MPPVISPRARRAARLICGLPFDTPQESAALAQVMLARFPADEYPHLAEFTFGNVMRPGYDFGHEYEFGLDLILDGLQRAHRTAQSRNRTVGDKSRTDIAIAGFGPSCSSGRARGWPASSAASREVVETARESLVIGTL